MKTQGEYLFEKIQDLKNLKEGDTYYIVIGTDIFPDIIEEISFSSFDPLELYVDEDDNQEWCTIAGKKYPEELKSLPKKLTELEFSFRTDKLNPLFSAFFLYPNLTYVKDKIRYEKEMKKIQLMREIEESQKLLDSLDQENG